MPPKHQKATTERCCTEASALPPELWSLCFDQLSFPDLCRCCQVCRLWNDLVCSLDNTRWKQLYNSFSEWRHPNWPIAPHLEPSSWKEALRDHYLANKVWCEYSKDLDQTQCLYVFRKRRDRRVLHVGSRCDFQNLKDALNNASAFDRILLHPGTYDEQFMMLSKLPLELVGCGKLGEVVLSASIELQAETARLCNLVIKAPWFTSTIIQSTFGHVQIDNCQFEDGNIEIHAPATCHIRFSKFKHAPIELDSLSIGLIENCEFTQSNSSAAINAWGYPSNDYGLVYKQLCETVQVGLSQCSVDHLKEHSGLSLLPNHLPNSKHDTKTLNSEVTASRVSQDGSSLSLNDDANDDPLLLYDTDTSEISTDSEESDVEQDSLPDPSVHRLSYLAGQRLVQSKYQDRSFQCNMQSQGSKHLEKEIRNYSKMKEIMDKIKGCLIRNCKIYKCQGGGIMVSCHGDIRLYRNDIQDCGYGIRCIQFTKVAILWNLIHHCRTSGIFMRLYSGGVVAGNDIYANGEAAIDIRKQADPVIQYNHIHHGKRSGIVVLGGGKGTICDNDIYVNKEAGIYILYKGCPIVSHNRVCNGKAAGIAINEHGRGQITGNFGHGVWIMSSSKPLVHGNQISNNNDAGIAFVAYRENAGHHGNMEAAGSHGNELEVPEEEDNNDLIPAMKVATVEHNSVYHNAGNGICIKGSDPIKLEANAIHGNCGTGIVVDQKPTATIINNSVTCNAGSGVAITENSSADLQGNGIYDNSKYGVVSRGSGRIVENDIVGNQMSGIQLGRGTSKGFQVLRNRVYSSNDHGITMLSFSCGLVEDNLLFSGLYADKYIHDNSQCVIRNNQVVQCEYTNFSDLSSESSTPHKSLQNGLGQSSECKLSPWKLENPPSRPHVTPPKSLPMAPSKHVTTTTRVRNPKLGTNQQGSKLCAIL
ncbi:F-box only protein 10-like isoform X2 [Ptychodera flava]|uniref:F-box only protein 10-like isoform X2 n=1 Tax=Ptychodera flava TaxID=63121 RepID=UPI00396A0900